MEDEELANDELALFAGNEYWRWRLTVGKVRSQLIFRTPFLIGFIFPCRHILLADNFVERYGTYRAASQYHPLFCNTRRVSDRFQPGKNRFIGTRILEKADTAKVLLPSPAVTRLDKRFEINKIRAYFSRLGSYVFYFLQKNRPVAVVPELPSRFFVSTRSCKRCAIASNKRFIVEMRKRRLGR